MVRKELLENKRTMDVGLVRQMSGAFGSLSGNRQPCAKHLQLVADAWMPIGGLTSADTREGGLAQVFLTTYGEAVVS